VTSEIAASIAVVGTLHLVNQSCKRRKIDEERLRLARGTHQLLRLVYGNAARQLASQRRHERTRRRMASCVR
jgi:hypothetical protein